MRSEVQVFPGPPYLRALIFEAAARVDIIYAKRCSSTLSIRLWNGGIAQLGERVLCKHEVVGSIPSASTRNCIVAEWGWRRDQDNNRKHLRQKTPSTEGHLREDSVFAVSADLGSS